MVGDVVHQKRHDGRNHLSRYKLHKDVRNVEVINENDTATMKTHHRLELQDIIQ